MKRKIEFDCVVCGTTTLDLLIGAIPLKEPIGQGKMHHIDPIQANVGGITSNSGTALARLGMRTAVLGYVGKDVWAEIIHKTLAAEGIDCTALAAHPDRSTCTTAIMVDAQKEHALLYYPGASSRLNPKLMLDHLPLFARSRWALLGYYGELPELIEDFPFVMEQIKKTGCQIAMDADNNGTSMKPLDRILPYLDIYFPNEVQAESQTGEHDPEKMIEAYRKVGATGLIGIKLGVEGALISPQAGKLFKVAVIAPPESLCDTLGAGDSFFAGLIAGLSRGLNVEDAGRLAAATGACNVSAVGGTAGLRSYAETATLAGLPVPTASASLSLNLAGQQTNVVFNQAEIETLHVPLLAELANLQKKQTGRLIVFLAGPPGSGKTTITALWETLAKQGRIDVPLQVLPLDGFHFPNEYLDEKTIVARGREVPLRSIKGSPETFDLTAIQATLAKIAQGQQAHWPIYDRQIHDPVPDVIELRDDGILVLEGNYLLLDESGWRDLQKKAHHTIFIEGSESLMRENVVPRLQRGGRSHQEASAQYDSVDHYNFQRINTYRLSVDTILRIDSKFQMRRIS